MRQLQVNPLPLPVDDVPSCQPSNTEAQSFNTSSTANFTQDPLQCHQNTRDKARDGGNRQRRLCTSYQWIARVPLHTFARIILNVPNSNIPIGCRYEITSKRDEKLHRQLRGQRIG